MLHLSTTTLLKILYLNELMVITLNGGFVFHALFFGIFAGVHRNLRTTAVPTTYKEYMSKKCESFDSSYLTKFTSIIYNGFNSVITYLFQIIHSPSYEIHKNSFGLIVYFDRIEDANLRMLIANCKILKMMNITFNINLDNKENILSKLEILNKLVNIPF